jgi:hypothetical protein
MEAKLQKLNKFNDLIELWKDLIDLIKGEFKKKN